MSVAKNTVLKLGTAGTPATPTDISTKASNVKFPREADEKESTTFQSGGAKQYQVGLTGSSLSFEVNYDTTIDAQLSALLGVEGVAFEYGPEGSTTGMTKYTGSGFVTKYEPPAQVGELMKATVEFRISGAVTRAAY